MTAPNQTRSFLMRRFAQVGIHPKSRHGQNFLIDMNLLRLLAQSADVGEHDVVLEIGTGTGSLTGLLAERAAEVVSVEVDPQMHLLASEELVDRPNVTLLLQDALRNKNNFNPVLLATLQEKLAVDPRRRLKLAANLPYNIATPVLSNLLRGPLVPVTMTATIQKEMADRIVAPPGNKDYGALSIWIQSQASARIVRTMPPEVFWPRPKVTSAIIHIEAEPERRAAIGDLEFFHTFVRALFFHRRKFLRSVVVSAMKDRLDREVVDEILAAQGLAASDRAEQLGVPEVLRLCQALQQAIPAE